MLSDTCQTTPTILMYQLGSCNYTLESVQRPSTRFVHHDYSRPSSLSTMLQILNWETLHERSKVHSNHDEQNRKQPCCYSIISSSHATNIHLTGTSWQIPDTICQAFFLTWHDSNLEWTTSLLSYLHNPWVIQTRCAECQDTIDSF